MHRYFYSIIGLIIAAIFWFADSSIHYFIYGEDFFEIIPSELNDLWMRTTISLLLALFGLFADFHHRRNLKREKKLAAVNIYTSTLYASHHILNNLLNQLLLFKFEALNCKEFDPKILQLYDTATSEAEDLIKRLSDIKKISDEDIIQSVKPR